MSAPWASPNGRLELAEAADITWIPRQDYRVAMDDGRQWLVATDQRDQRRAMVTCGYDRDLMLSDPIGFTWEVVWSALTRTHAYSDGWAVFQADVAGVELVTDDDGEPAPLDPTQTAGAD